MNANVWAVNQAITAYLASMGRRGIDPGGVRARTLAHFAGMPTGEMSLALQEYVKAQGSGRGQTQYVIGCRGYGREARWHILARPGSDPQVVQENRRLHGLWIVEDALRRLYADQFREVLPGLQGTTLDLEIEALVRLGVQQFEASVTFIRSRLT